MSRKRLKRIEEKLDILINALVEYEVEFEIDIASGTSAQIAAESGGGAIKDNVAHINYNSHYITRCITCAAVIEQCRCPGSKIEYVSTCKICLEKTSG